MKRSRLIAECHSGDNPSDRSRSESGRTTWRDHPPDIGDVGYREPTARFFFWPLSFRADGFVRQRRHRFVRILRATRRNPVPVLPRRCPALH